MSISTETAVTIVCAALAVGLAGDGVAVWRRGRRAVGAVHAVAAAPCALIAMRYLPDPAVVALLLAGLGVIAAVTAWPLLATACSRARHTDATRGHRTTQARQVGRAGRGDRR